MPLAAKAQTTRESQAASRALQRVPADAVRGKAPTRDTLTGEACACNDGDPSLAFADIVDRTMHFAISRATAGLSPAAVGEAYFDWLIHLLAAPGKQTQLWHKGLRKWLRWLHFAATSTSTSVSCIEPLPQDKRFKAEAWKTWPFNLISQAFLLQQQWWHNATVGIRGVTPQHEQQVEFATRQLLDMFSPSNFMFTNPEVLEKTRAEFGAESRSRLLEPRGGLRACLERPPTGRPERVQGRRQSRHHRRRGDLPQRADRAHSVRAPPQDACRRNPC